jgi:hypothetical protein
MRISTAFKILSGILQLGVWKFVVCLALFSFFSAVVSTDLMHSQERGDRLNISLDRQNKAPVTDSRNPDHILSFKKIQEIFLELAEEPKDWFFIEKSIEGTGIKLDDLMSSKLLIKKDDLYVLGFSLFTSKDQERVRAICGKIDHFLDLPGFFIFKVIWHLGKINMDSQVTKKGRRKAYLPVMQLTFGSPRSRGKWGVR